MTDPRLALKRRPAKYAQKPPPSHPIPVWEEEASQVLQENWDHDYFVCPTFSSWWVAIHSGGEWPQGCKIFRKKMLFEEQLCVPTDRVVELIDAHHRWNAHQAPKRLLPELLRHYKFPEEVDVPKTVAAIKKGCQICQACEAPNRALKGPISMTPIPPRVFASVSLDVFQMPEVEFSGQKFDAFFLMVDRHSGWMVARPTQYEGLTGEKAAKLLFDSSWGELAVPSIVTCDRGAQFISDWWKTMCTRLGVRMAFSQAYRPQSNGRAEVAGRVIKDMLRKMHAENAINWVEALPRILRVQHGSIDPILGMSPYEAIFGRQRCLAALPWWYSGELQDATEFFQRMDEIDQICAQKLNTAHKETENLVNEHRAKKGLHLKWGTGFGCSNPSPLVE